MLTKIPRGTKDITPDEIYKWQHIEKTARETCRAFGFTELRFPTFEYTELFSRGVGDTTDVVQKEMYTFLDRDGRSITLRPEGTASTARAFLQNSLYAGALPSKLFYLIPCFRYEKPQAGRLREFHQFGAEIFGAPGPLAEVEIITLIDAYLKKLGIGDIALNLNSLGCAGCRKDYQAALYSFFDQKKEKLCDLCNERLKKNPMRIIDCKNPNCKAEISGMPGMLDFLCGECAGHFEEVKKLLSTLGIEFSVDPAIVRGLDYYTRTVFEFVSDKIGAQGTVCGGGRYDNLTEEIGGQSFAGIGFAMGLERIILLLEAQGAKIPKPEPPALFLIPMGEKARDTAGEIVLSLRRADVPAQLDLLSRSVKAQMKYADKLGARYSAVLGEEELLSGVVQVKNMQSGAIEKIKVDEFVPEFLRTVKGETL